MALIKCINLYGIKCSMLMWNTVSNPCVHCPPGESVAQTHSCDNIFLSSVSIYVPIGQIRDMAVRRGVLRGGVAAGRRDHRGDPPPACPPPWGPWKRLCIQMRRWKIIQIFIYSTDTYTHTRTHSKHTHVPCTQQAHTGTLHTASTHRHPAHSKHTQAPCT